MGAGAHPSFFDTTAALVSASGVKNHPALTRRPCISTENFLAVYFDRRHKENNGQRRWKKRESLIVFQVGEDNVNLTRGGVDRGSLMVKKELTSGADVPRLVHEVIIFMHECSMSL